MWDPNPEPHTIPTKDVRKIAFCLSRATRGPALTRQAIADGKSPQPGNLSVVLYIYVSYYK
jgi:hypothetical protein